jgi:uncharacterized protein affecting Mg2+/Co2+ transport
MVDEEEDEEEVKGDGVVGREDRQGRDENERRT